MQDLKQIAVIVAFSHWTSIFCNNNRFGPAFAQEGNTTSTTGQITKGEIVKGEIKAGNITKGTVRNETVTGADIKGANITELKWLV